MAVNITDITHTTTTAADTPSDIVEHAMGKAKFNLEDMNSRVIRAFPAIINRILSTYYLKPFAPNATIVPRGIIARETHGAMHAVRVAIYTEVLHQINKQYLEKETNKTLKVLQAYFGCGEQELIMLNQLAGIFHDCARKGEGQDVWEKESGEKFLTYLVNESELNFDRISASIYFYAIAYKDDSEKFKKMLASLNFKAELIEACDYIRQLLHDADCLDVIRCVSEFYIDRLIIYQKARNNNQQEMMQAVVALTSNVHERLHAMGDLLWDCKLMIKSVDKKYTEEVQRIVTGSNFSLRIKTPYEHAHNVYYKITKSLAGSPCFKSSLTAHIDVNVKKFLDKKWQDDFGKIEAGFNPFIHGTNSSVLAILPATKFEFISPLDMMEKYGVAPMSGEIAEGGAMGPLSEGAVRFGRLGNSDANREYSLSRVVESYAKPKLKKFKAQDLEDAIKKLRKHFFYNINEFLVLLCRTKQSGIELPKSELSELKTEIELAVKFYYLVLCVLDHLQPNLTVIKQCSELNVELVGTYRYPGIILKRFTQEYLQDFIRKNNLDCKKIWENPTQSNIEVLLKIFEFEIPKSIGLVDVKAKECQTATGKKYNPEIVRLFCPVVRSQSNIRDRFQNYYSTNFEGFVNHSSNGKKIQEILNTIFIGDTSENFQHMRAMKVELVQYVQILEKRLASMQTILNTVPNLKVFQSPLVTNPFPVVFISENEDVIQMQGFSSKEFSVKPGQTMVLGRQMSLIATDSHQNQERIREYLIEHQLSVPVVLFTDLTLGETPAIATLHYVTPRLLKPEATEVVMSFLYENYKTQTHAVASATAASPNILVMEEEPHSDRTKLTRGTL